MVKNFHNIADKLGMVINKFKNAVTTASSIVITTHAHPDADGIGSQVALCMALKEIGKKVVCVNDEPLLNRYAYLDPSHYIISHDEFLEKYGEQEIDLFIVVDTSSIRRIGHKMEVLSTRANHILFIDHHPCDESIKVHNCIDPSKAATGELMGCLIESLGVKFTKDMALPLYTAILIDTSSFRYPTVTHLTHELVTKLLKTGVKPPDAFNLINGTKQLKYMKLLGHVLSGTQLNKKGNIAWIAISENDMKVFDVDSEDTHPYINQLLILDKLDVACMFVQHGDFVKVSLRSDGKIDVGQIAQELGGGGHNHSAATVIKGEFNAVIHDTIIRIEKLLA